MRSCKVIHYQAHPDEERAQNIMGYIAEKVERQYRVGRDLAEVEGEDDRASRQVPQQPVFPRLSMQYHNYTRWVAPSS